MAAEPSYEDLWASARAADGYFDATKLCSSFRMKPTHYLRGARVSALLAALAEQLAATAPGSDIAAARASLVRVQHGGAQQGTWVHERVAVDLARWLSPAFGAWAEARPAAARNEAPAPPAEPSYEDLWASARAADGYFDATKLCSSFRRKVFNYLKSARVSALLGSLAEQLAATAPGSDIAAARASLVRVQCGGAQQGTWVHERVAVDLARWLSPAFGAWTEARSAARNEAPAPPEASEPSEPSQPAEAPEASSNTSWEMATRSYDGLPVERRVSDGYFNATRMCLHFHKRFFDYERGERAAEYLDALAREISKSGIPVLGVSYAPSRAAAATRGESERVDFADARAALVHVQHGGVHRGTWVHERVAVDLARWLSPAFAVWMDGWVLEAMGLSTPQAREAPETPQAQLPSAQPLHVPPLPEIIRHERSVALPGSGHLYAARRQPDGLTKIGVSKDPLDRMPELQRSFQAPYDLLAVWPGEEALEELVLDKLRPHRAAVGASREHFTSQVTLDHVRKVVDCARELHRTKLELAAQSFEQRKRELELQADLEDRAAKRRREEARERREEARERREEALAQEDLKDRAVKRKRDELLQSLVEEKHPEATQVFLQQFLRPACL